MAGINELKQKIESDTAFKESLQKSADVREFMDKIKAAGFEITPEELANTVNGKGAEIRDEELEAVAGGIKLDDLRVDCNFGGRKKENDGEITEEHMFPFLI